MDAMPSQREMRKGSDQKPEDKSKSAAESFDTPREGQKGDGAAAAVTAEITREAASDIFPKKFDNTGTTDDPGYRPGLTWNPMFRQWEKPGTFPWSNARQMSQFICQINQSEAELTKK